MSKNGHTHNNNSAAFAAELVLYVWPFLDIRHWRVKRVEGLDWNLEMVLSKLSHICYFVTDMHMLGKVGIAVNVEDIWNN